MGVIGLRPVQFRKIISIALTTALIGCICIIPNDETALPCELSELSNALKDGADPMKAGQRIVANASVNKIIGNFDGYPKAHKEIALNLIGDSRLNGRRILNFLSDNLANESSLPSGSPFPTVKSYAANVYIGKENHRLFLPIFDRAFQDSIAGSPKFMMQTYVAGQIQSPSESILERLRLEGLQEASGETRKDIIFALRNHNRRYTRDVAASSFRSRSASDELRATSIVAICESSGSQAEISETIRHSLATYISLTKSGPKTVATPMKAWRAAARMLSSQTTETINWHLKMAVDSKNAPYTAGCMIAVSQSSNIDSHALDTLLSAHEISPPSQDFELNYEHARQEDGKFSGRHTLLDLWVDSLATHHVIAGPKLIKYLNEERAHPSHLVEAFVACLSRSGSVKTDLDGIRLLWDAILNADSAHIYLGAIGRHPSPKFAGILGYLVRNIETLSFPLKSSLVECLRAPQPPGQLPAIRSAFHQSTASLSTKTDLVEGLGGHDPSNALLIMCEMLADPSHEATGDETFASLFSRLAVQARFNSENEERQAHLSLGMLELVGSLPHTSPVRAELLTTSAKWMTEAKSNPLRVIISEGRRKLGEAEPALSPSDSEQLHFLDQMFPHRRFLWSDDHEPAAHVAIPNVELKPFFTQLAAQVAKRATKQPGPHGIRYGSFRESLLPLFYPESAVDLPSIPKDPGADEFPKYWLKTLVELDEINCHLMRSIASRDKRLLSIEPKKFDLSDTETRFPICRDGWRVGKRAFDRRTGRYAERIFFNDGGGVSVVDQFSFLPVGLIGPVQTIPGILDSLDAPMSQPLIDDSSSRTILSSRLRTNALSSLKIVISGTGQDPSALRTALAIDSQMARNDARRLDRLVTSPRIGEAELLLPSSAIVDDNTYNKAREYLGNAEKLAGAEGLRASSRAILREADKLPDEVKTFVANFDPFNFKIGNVRNPHPFKASVVKDLKKNIAEADEIIKKLGQWNMRKIRFSDKTHARLARFYLSRDLARLILIFEVSGGSSIGHRFFAVELTHDKLSRQLVDSILFNYREGHTLLGGIAEMSGFFPPLPAEEWTASVSGIRNVWGRVDLESLELSSPEMLYALAAAGSSKNGAEAVSAEFGKGAAMAAEGLALAFQFRERSFLATLSNELAQNTKDEQQAIDSAVAEAAKHGVNQIRYMEERRRAQHDDFYIGISFGYSEGGEWAAGVHFRYQDIGVSAGYGNTGGWFIKPEVRGIDVVDVFSALTAQLEQPRPFEAPVAPLSRDDFQLQTFLPMQPAEEVAGEDAAAPGILKPDKDNGVNTTNLGYSGIREGHTWSAAPPEPRVASVPSDLLAIADRFSKSQFKEWAERTGKVQLNDFAAGVGDVHTDRLAIEITRIPPGQTAASIWKDFQRGLNRSADSWLFNQMAVFERREKPQWHGPILGGVYDIWLGPVPVRAQWNNMPVMVVDQTSRSFTFHTLKGHPVVGLRQFNYEVTANGGMRISTIGITRIDDEHWSSWLPGSFTRGGQNLTWIFMLNGIGENVESRGGEATEWLSIPRFESNNIDYDTFRRSFEKSQSQGGTSPMPVH